MIHEYKGRRPIIGQRVFIAPNASVIGDVEIGDDASIWFGAVLRGDKGRIVIGRGSNIQDNAVLHANPSHSTFVGDEVTIGHGALLEGCIIENGAVIGMGAVILPEVLVGEQAMIAAGSVLTSETRVPARTLAAGAPAQVKKDLSGAALRSVEVSASSYRELKNHYLDDQQREDDGSAGAGRTG